MSARNRPGLWCVLAASAPFVAATITAAAVAAEVAIAPHPADPAWSIVVFRGDDAIGWTDAADQIAILADTFGGGDQFGDAAAWFAPASTAEIDTVATLAASLGPWECVGPWLGVVRDGAAAPITDGWLAAADGTPLAAPPWSSDSPQGAAPLRWVAALDGREETLAAWINLLPDLDAGPGSFGFVAVVPGDWPDCDRDGIPDAIEVAWLATEPCDASCPADLDGDGAVGGSDLGLWLVQVGEACESAAPCVGDFNRDGEVSGADLGILLAAWGDCG